MQKGDNINAYYFWKTETGIPKQVKLLNYLGDQLHKNKTRIHRDSDGSQFIGEKWEALYNGEVIEVIIRVPYNSDMDSNSDSVGWSYSKISEVPKDNMPNPIVDPAEHFDDDSNSIYNEDKHRKYTNQELEQEKEKDTFFESVLDTIVNSKFAKVVGLHKAFRKSPSNKTMTSFKEADSEEYRKALKTAKADMSTEIEEYQQQE